MGICNVSNDRSRKVKDDYTPNSNNENGKLTTPQAQNNIEKTRIINRLSERTKYDNINNYYSISETFLGKGATGIVREGFDKKGTKYAIKTVWKSDIEQNECFKREIDITLEVSHESIIKCNDIFEDNNCIHFVLEEISGGDLFDHIIHSEGRKLGEEEAMDLLRQMLEGLQYLHVELGIVHRDIKPENYLLYNEKGRNKLKLIDFGFATYCKNGETMSEQLGTPQYAAPEIFEEKPYTNKVDLWSTGVVLYNMVKGTQPFTGQIENIKEQVLNKEVDYNGFKNTKLKDLCKNLLERDPDKRYSAYQALTELELITGRGDGLDTVAASFKPDIHKIMFILYNDRTIIEELKNIFLSESTPEELDKMFEEILEKNKKLDIMPSDTNFGIASEKLYMKAEKLIEFGEKSNNSSEKLKNRLKRYSEQKVMEKMKKQMINVNRFFVTLIESIKFIRKARCLNEFRKLDKYNLGWINYAQLNRYFADPIKKHNIKTHLNKNDKIQFETFFKISNEYDGVKSAYNDKKINKRNNY